MGWPGELESSVLESVVICPRCGNYACSRSHRRKLEYLLPLFGLRPWRCGDCRKRFYGRRVPLHLLLYAHCSKCGNLALMTISRERLARKKVGGRIAMWFGARPVRCEDCRNDFGTWLPLRRAEDAPERAGEFEQQTVDSDK